MILKKLYHENLKVCHPKDLLLLPLLIIVFLHQLTGMEIKSFVYHDEIKEINIRNHTCYYFDEIFKIENLDLDNGLIDEKLY